MRTPVTLRLVFGLSLALVSLLGYSEAPKNFSAAKKRALQLFSKQSVTLYCGCHYTNKVIDLNSCGMQSAEGIKRAHRLEWEHMMPAENFGRQLTCWREKICTAQRGKAYKGHRCCDKNNAAFKKMEADLHNL